MLDRLRKRLRDVVSRGSEGFLKIRELRDHVFTALAENDVDVETADYVADLMEKNLSSLGRKIRVEDYRNALKKSLLELMAEYVDPSDPFREEKKPFVVLFLGVNGGGKTTTISKIAHLLRKRGGRVVISASDTFRAGAIEQIQMLGDKVGADVVKQKQGADPAAVAFDAVNRARARGFDFVLVDSAGRMQTNKNLIQEMKKIKRVAKPDLTILVLDALTGQDAIEQAKTFLEEITYDGVILTKLDTDARGGSVISIIHQLKKPIYYIGVGQTPDDLIPFSPEWLVEKLFSNETS